MDDKSLTATFEFYDSYLKISYFVLSIFLMQLQARTQHRTQWGFFFLKTLLKVVETLQSLRIILQKVGSWFQLVLWLKLFLKFW